MKVNVEVAVDISIDLTLRNRIKLVLLAIRPCKAVKFPATSTTVIDKMKDEPTKGDRHGNERYRTR